jgi:hypothetical protein
MAAPTSGEITLNDIYTESGGTSLQPSNLGLSQIQAIINNAPNSTSKFSDFYKNGTYDAYLLWDTVADFTITTYTSGSSGFGPTINCGLRLKSGVAATELTAATTGVYTTDPGKLYASSASAESLWEVSYSKVSGVTLDTLPPQNSALSADRTFALSGGGTSSQTAVYDITVTYSLYRTITGTVRVTFQQLDTDPT